MAVTTEPGLRVARSKDITHEDFVDALDRIEPAATPMLSFCQNEVKLKAIDRTWNVDTYPGPKGAVGRADNEDAPASGSALSRDWSSNIRKMGNIAQGFSETYRVGWIAGKVPEIAGVDNIEAYAEAGAYQMLKRHMEVAFESMDQVAVYDQGPGLGAVGAGYRMLIDYNNKYAAASVYAIGQPTDLHYAPTGACTASHLTGTAGPTLAATFSRAFVKSVAKALRVAAQQKTDWTLIAGLGLRQAVTDLTIPSQVQAPAASAIAGDQVRVLLRNESDSVLGATVDTIVTDFGRIMVVESDWIGTTISDATGGTPTGVNSYATARALVGFYNCPNYGILVKRGNLFKTWGVPPYTEKIAPLGGGDTMDAKCLAMLGVRNPILGAFWQMS